METDEARAFARRWLEAWNAHDLEAVLGHFAEDVVFTSPLAADLVPGSDGVIRGRAALRAYWAEGLRRNPDLRFAVEGIYAGVDTVVIRYRNQRRGAVCEVLTLAGGLVATGHATYAVDAADG